MDRSKLEEKFISLIYEENSKLFFDKSNELHSNFLIQGDNLPILQKIPSKSIDLIYLDPPFFTGKDRSLKGKRVYREGDDEYLFRDTWEGKKEYVKWMNPRLIELQRILKDSGAIYLHCDWHASHRLRLQLDEVFGEDQFRSEIVWAYKRWTNTLKSFQRSHELIYFYSKTDNYKFNVLYDDYSFTTNVDQIWQERVRNSEGKSKYKKIDDTPVPLGKDKAGVPMRDVWEIPYLNPKARERTGYPTQKPVQLLLRIIQASSGIGNIILDPFVGSGTTVVAAELLGRRWIGIDVNPDAINICKTRLTGDIRKKVTISHYQPYKLSKFLKLLRYQQIEYIAKVLDMNIVRRNRTLDGILKRSGGWKGVGVKYMEEGDVEQEVKAFANSTNKRGIDLGIVIIPQVNNKEKKDLESIGFKDFAIRVFNFKDLHNSKMVKEILLK